MARAFLHNICTFDGPTYFSPTLTRCELPPTTDTLQFLHERSSVSISAASVLTASHRGLALIERCSHRSPTWFVQRNDLLISSLGWEAEFQTCHLRLRRLSHESFQILLPSLSGTTIEFPFFQRALIYGERLCSVRRPFPIRIRSRLPRIIRPGVEEHYRAIVPRYHIVY